MTFTQLFATWRRAALFILVSSVVFFSLIFFARINFIMEVFSEQASLHEGMIHLFARAWYWSLLDLSFLQIGINIIIAMLFGMNTISILYMIRMHRAAYVSALSLVSAGALATAIFGLLCISCGALFIIPVISLFGASFLLLLPFRGFEFNILSIILLGASLWFTYKKFSSSNFMRPIR